MPLAKEILDGTPLLLRTVDASNKERLQICTCRIDPTGQVLKMAEQGGSGRAVEHEVRINTIAEVAEEPCAADGEDEGEPGMIRLKFKGGQPKPMELICASREDFVAWRDGLRSLMSALRSPAAKASPKASPKAQANTRTARTIGVSTGVGSVSIPPNSAETITTAGIPSAGIGQLLERMRLQEELITELRQENGVLTEMVKQKDTVIHQLTTDLRSRGTKNVEVCSKTESTSRESDDHLHHRETAILKRKNLRLKQKVQKDKHTIASLMQTLQNALKGEASDADGLKTEDDADEMDSDNAMGAPAVPRSPARAAAQQGLSDGSESEDPAIREEMAALTGKLAMLEREVEEMSMPEGGGTAMAAAMLAARQGVSPGASRFAPPPRSAPAAQQAAERSPSLAALPQQVAAQRAAMAAAQAAAPPRGMAGFDFSAVGGVPSLGSMSKGSKSALEGLARETQLLEEKKRVVEKLARQLEPASDGEEDDEDDGFPLQ